ncbi:rhodanese-like domain-containing protein [Occallatibacter riparius]|uniref:Rhodanese-like domain-containing protein n=1 Tax=Occallatibacter riparius TaxID=1002689 RepID=A0A9J7BQH7_9BACT|nr:rhodanese-like domain-containing protein [Occallatibacter riparius]UWZ83349.1 rhodanese-like domain-containing protein [Occallatibacter riparius]
MRIRTSLALFLIALSGFFASTAHAQFSPAPQSATTIPDSNLIRPEHLNSLLMGSVEGLKQPPLVIQVGSQIFFRQAHIKGSVYAGPGSQAAGLDLLEKAVAPLPKNKFIVLYCGCCPWNRCPNVGPAYKRLADLGYTNVKVLYMANNFGDDWVSKGYPTEK